MSTHIALPELADKLNKAFAGASDEIAEMAGIRGGFPLIVRDLMHKYLDTILVDLSAQQSETSAEVERLGTEIHRLLTVGGVESLAIVRGLRAELKEWQLLQLWGTTPEIVHEFIKGQQVRIYAVQDIEKDVEETVRLLERLLNQAEACKEYRDTFTAELSLSVRDHLAKLKGTQ